MAILASLGVMMAPAGEKWWLSFCSEKEKSYSSEVSHFGMFFRGSTGRFMLALS